MPGDHEDLLVEKYSVWWGPVPYGFCNDGRWIIVVESGYQPDHVQVYLGSTMDGDRDHTRHLRVKRSTYGSEFEAAGFSSDTWIDSESFSEIPLHMLKKPKGKLTGELLEDFKRFVEE